MQTKPISSRKTTVRTSRITHVSFEQMIKECSERSAAFMKSVKGIPVHHVRVALGTFTPGWFWTDYPKSAMAGCYGNAILPNPSTWVAPFLADLDLESLKRRCVAHQSGSPDWRTA